MKKTPQEYSINYCGEDIKAPKTDLNKKLWIVFSDRENNATYQNPGGKVKMKRLEFLEPFVVIKEKGDFLCLVKYDSEIIDSNLLNNKFKDRKKAQYYGWINKSNLLLTRQSVTDIATGFKNKQIGMLSDTIALSQTELFFSKDSIKTFKDLNLTSNNKNTPFYEILYTLKISPDRQKTLVARKVEISPDSVNNEVLGWVHSSLIKDIGQRLHVNTNSLTFDSLSFVNKAGWDTILISQSTFAESERISYTHNTLRYAPVSSWNNKGSTLKMKTHIPLSVLDKKNNYVFNVNGNKIWYNEFRKLEKDLKKINIMFVFEGKKQIIDNFSSMVNVVQNLQPMFDGIKDGFNYQFGSVIALQGSDTISGPLIKKQEFTSDYTKLIEHLVSENDDIYRARPLPTGHTWRGVRAAVDMMAKKKDDTNLLIIMGESGYSESVDTLLLNKITNYNCRVLGFQLHGEVTNASNNFVLQIENMINYYASKKMFLKRNIIVYPDQLGQQNRYKERAKNLYALDFPDKSMTQGWILFPEKNETLPFDILTNSIDSLVAQIKWDNHNLAMSLDKAFNTTFVDYFTPALGMDKSLPTFFSGQQMPVWYLPSQQLVFPDSIANNINYQLLLSKDELDELNEFIDFLCTNELDYKYKNQKRKKKNYCNCPDDDLIESQNLSSNQTRHEYRSTKKARKNVQNLYLTELKTCKLCKIKTKHLKKYTLAEAQRRITGCPTQNELLNKYTINDIKKRNKIGDAKLDELIIYIKQKKEDLDKHLHNANLFESNGQMYYWIDQRLLP
jgi:hypothetical protein